MSQVNMMNNVVNTFRGFDKVLNTVKFIKAENGNCEATIKITADHLNPMGRLHGGFSATLVHSVSGHGLLTHKTWSEPSSSININLLYLKGAKEGDELKIISNILQTGKNMAFLDVEIRDLATDQLLVKGEYTKFKIRK